MRLIAIGDTHGCLDSLENLIDKLEVTQEDTVVFLGDYIDRGPKPVETVDFVLEFQEKFPNTVLLRGNHDEMMIKTILENNRMWGQTWWHNGGAGTEERYTASNRGIGEAATQLKNATDLVYKHSVGEIDYHFIHAGYFPEIPVLEQYEDLQRNGMGSMYEDAAMWNRSHVKYALDNKPNEWEDNVVVVCGHTPMDDVLSTDKLVCLDTGAVFGGKLTAMVVDEENNRNFVQVEGLIR